MKYTTGGVSGAVGEALTVEVPLKGKPAPAQPSGGGGSPQPSGGGGGSPQPQAAVDPNDPTKDDEFTEGVDVSAAQYPPNIKWDVAFNEGKLRFMYAQMDKAGPDHIRRAHDKGLLCGAYHFAIFPNDPTQAADKFLKSCEGLPIDLPAMLDVETQPNLWKGKKVPQILDWMRTWLSHVEQATGKKPVIYTYPSWWKELLKAGLGDEWPAYGLWIATYASKPSIPPPWTDWTLWQHHGNTIWINQEAPHDQKWGPNSPGPTYKMTAKGGKVPGMVGEVDCDRFHGNLAAFKTWAGAAGGPAPQPQPKPAPSVHGGDDPKPAKPADKPADKPAARPGYDLLPEDLKAKYLHVSFTLDGEQVDFSLEHLKYHNVGRHPADKKEALMGVVQGLVRELQKNDPDLLEQMVGKKFATGSPVFAFWPFMGKGSPEQILAALKIVGHFGKARLRSDWIDRGSLSDSLAAFYKANWGLDCNGFAGNYAAAIGAPNLTPDTYIPNFAPEANRRHSVDEIQPGDVIIWGKRHIATIQGRRADGLFDIVESSGETEVQGLGNTVRELTSAGSDEFKVRKLHLDTGKLGVSESVWVATLK